MTTEHVCVLCAVYRPSMTPRHAAVLCPPDLVRLEHDLLALPALYRRLAEGEPTVRDHRFCEVLDGDGSPTGQLRLRDPVAGTLSAGTVNAKTQQPNVSGTRQAPLPINVDAVDLTLPARAVHGSDADQIGYLPVASVLDEWARYVRTELHPDFTLPEPRVDTLVSFLHKHLHDLVEQLPGVLPALAVDLRRLGAGMRAVLGDVEIPPRPLAGVLCAGCREVFTIVAPSALDYAECLNCGKLYTPQQRAELARAQVAAMNRQKVTVNGCIPGLPGLT